MRKICAIVSYDGTDYHGFQVQPSNRTVQGELERALFQFTKETIKIDGSGRTDAGVHAIHQVISFRIESSIPAENIATAMNKWLPPDIIVQRSLEMPDDFHARISAVRKSYRYSISRGKQPDIFTRRYRYHHYRPLDVDAMREALPHFLGEHDFTSFTSQGAMVRSKVRTIYHAELLEDGGDLHFYTTGNGFLFNMVRIMAGTLVFVGMGKLRPDSIPSIIEAKDRLRAGPKADAKGLTLWNVEYPEPYASMLE